MVVMKRITRQRGKGQGDMGLRAELAMETPTATTCTRSGPPYLRTTYATEERKRRWHGTSRVRSS